MMCIVKLAMLCGLCVTLAAAQPFVELERAFPSLRFSSPVGLESAFDGTNRIFVVEQDGIIKVFENNDGVVSTGIFLDISDRVTSGGEMGLLGLAFHPQYKTNGYFYVNYTNQTDSLRTFISRFSVSPTDPDSADRESEKILLSVTQPYTNHNGGALAFGPDGYLYIGLGDGGSGGDPHNYAQNRSVLLGKILRIDVDSQSGGLPYGIPPDNPFVGNLSGWREEIYAYGLRNPWRFSFDAATSLLWCGDVGQSAREEVDLIEKGGNYGWRIMEGTLCHNPRSGCDTSGLIMPIWDYGRTEGGSITGGFVYRGRKLPQLTGLYVYGDFVSGRIWALAYNGPGSVVNIPLDTAGVYTLSSFGIDEDGELYCCSLGGEIFRFKPRNPPSSADQERSNQPLFRLFQNHPNPFNSSTSVIYELPFSGRVNLSIFDPLGRTIKVLVDEEQPVGRHAQQWNSSAPSGLYYCRLTLSGPGGSLARTIPLMLLR